MINRYLVLVLASALPVLSSSYAEELAWNAQLIEFAKKGDADRARRALDAGAHPNSRNRKSETALFLFAKAGNLDLVKQLAGKGADVNLATLDKVTPLMAAVYENKPQVPLIY